MSIHELSDEREVAAAARKRSAVPASPKIAPLSVQDLAGISNAALARVLTAGKLGDPPQELSHVVQQGQGRVARTRRTMVRVVREPPPSSPAALLTPRSGTAIQRYQLKFGQPRNECGTDMHVYIHGKNDRDLNAGSDVGAWPTWWPDMMNASTDVLNFFSKFVVQGHLLNQRLGGPGNRLENLAPITKSTNTTHSTRIEEKVIDLVHNQDQVVEYHVEAKYDQNGPPISDLGITVPPKVATYLPHFPVELAADYTVWAWDASADDWRPVPAMSAPGDLLIKNEGKQLKGTF
jgi:hypothetical protein